MTALSNAPLVMIWRRVQDLPAAQRTVRRVNGWPPVGEDSFSAMYDAGNVLIAFWNQAEFLREEAQPADRGARSNRLDGAIAKAASSCGSSNFELRSTAFNPSNQLTIAVGDTNAVAESLSDLAGRPLRPLEAEDRIGRAISFVDDVGNTTRYVRLSGAAAGDGIGRRLKSLRDGGFNADTARPVIGYELLVSDLEEARRFYSRALGLNTIEARNDSVVFDTGNLFLTLRQEPSAGLVKTIERAGKLGDDLAVFYAEDVEAAVDELTRSGVRFPSGIENSEHGRLAVFKDPDGHALSVWQAPQRSRTPEIDYFPVLDRLLNGAAAHGYAG